MVARTLPFKRRDKPNEELPSISDEMQRQTEADQKDIGKQLKHAQQQLELTNVYPFARATPNVPSVANARFAPKATQVLRCRETSLCARTGREQVQQTAR